MKMSNLEKCHELINRFTEDQLDNVVVLLATAHAMVEAADDVYCLNLLHEYEMDCDNDEPMDIKEFAAQLGVSL